MSGLALLLSFTIAVSGIRTQENIFPGAYHAAFIPAEKTIVHQLGDKTISFKVIQYGQSVNTCCINVHDNEKTAVEAARSLLEQQGGVLIKIDNNAQRIISFPFKGVVYSFDPNRIFSASGLHLKQRGK